MRKIQRRKLHPRLLNTSKMALVYDSLSQKLLEACCAFQGRHIYPLPHTHFPPPLQDSMKTLPHSPQKNHLTGHAVFPEVLDSYSCGVICFSHSYALTSLKHLLKTSKEINFPQFDNFSACHSIRKYFVPSSNIFLLLIRDYPFVLAQVDMENP